MQIICLLLELYTKQNDITCIATVNSMYHTCVTVFQFGCHGSHHTATHGSHSYIRTIRSSSYKPHPEVMLKGWRLQISFFKVFCHYI